MLPRSFLPPKSQSLQSSDRLQGGFLQTLAGTGLSKIGGDPVGAGEGKVLGRVEGLSKTGGDTVGAGEGKVLGRVDGDTLGEAEEATVGDSDGARLGDTVGISDAISFTRRSPLQLISVPVLHPPVLPIPSTFTVWSPAATSPK